MAPSVEILSEEEALAPILREWDELAVRLASPFSAPSWMLAWWRHSRPAGAALRVAVAHENGRLLGIAPLWVADPSPPAGHYDVLAARLSPPACVLVDPARTTDVTPVIAKALAKSQPRPSLLRLEGSRATHATTTEALLDSWPGLRPAVQLSETVPMPIATLEHGGHEGWLERRDRKFLGNVRRRRRHLDEAGGRLDLAGPDDVPTAVDAFIELHGRRWSKRGGSTALVPGIREMLLDAARTLVPQQRLRVFTLAVEDRIVAVQILVAAGEEVAVWNGGFDEGARQFSPSIQVLFHAIADADKRGESRFSLGPGGQSYKEQLTDTNDVMEVRKAMPKGRAYPLTRVRMARDLVRDKGPAWLRGSRSDST